MIRSQIVVTMALVLLTGSALCGSVAPERIFVRDPHIEATFDGTGRSPVIFESGRTAVASLSGDRSMQVAPLTLSHERADLGRSDPGSLYFCLPRETFSPQDFLTFLEG